MELKNKLCIVTSSPGARDTIYVGYTSRVGDMLMLTQASMILYYEEVGVPGLTTQPEYARRLRPVTSGGEAIIPLSSVAAIVAADPEAWKDHLGVSR